MLIQLVPLRLLDLDLVKCVKMIAGLCNSKILQFCFRFYQYICTITAFLQLLIREFDINFFSIVNSVIFSY